VVLEHVGVVNDPLLAPMLVVGKVVDQAAEVHQEALLEVLLGLE